MFYLDGVEDGLQGREGLCEELVPHVGEDIELVLTCGIVTASYYGNTLTLQQHVLHIPGVRKSASNTRLL